MRRSVSHTQVEFLKKTELQRKWEEYNPNKTKKEEEEEDLFN